MVLVGKVNLKTFRYMQALNLIVYQYDEAFEPALEACGDLFKDDDQIIVGVYCNDINELSEIVEKVNMT